MSPVGTSELVLYNLKQLIQHDKNNLIYTITLSYFRGESKKIQWGITTQVRTFSALGTGVKTPRYQKWPFIKNKNQRVRVTTPITPSRLPIFRFFSPEADVRTFCHDADFEKTTAAYVKISIFLWPLTFPSSTPGFNVVEERCRDESTGWLSPHPHPEVLVLIHIFAAALKSTMSSRSTFPLWIFLLDG